MMALSPALRPLLAIVALAAGRPHAEDFPAFRVPGREAEMRSLNALLRLHYGPRTATTLWDMWIPRASLWEAVGPAGSESADDMRGFYRRVLLDRRIDAEGYVATQQHRGLAHSDGWPFPTWNQAAGAGWHFSLEGDGYATMLGVRPATSLDGWKEDGLAPGAIDLARGVPLAIAADAATLATPAFRAPEGAWPFVRIEWSVRGATPGARAFVEWSTAEKPGFDESRRAAVDLPASADAMTYANVPVSRQPAWGGTLTGLRLRFEGMAGAEVILKSLITAIDTRHPVNNPTYVVACADYFDVTTDVAFLRANVGRMRGAIRYALDEFDVREEKMVVVPWVGHDGRSGLGRDEKGRRVVHIGRGVGNNYWDLLPFGGRDFQATLYLFAALGRLEAVERAIDAHPEWGIPAGADRMAPDELRGLADAIRSTAGARFWDADAGRFAGWIDRDGKSYDYGFTTQNNEAIAYGFATDEQAHAILNWLDGRRTVAGDTSTGADIYRWRFAPRATTRRNVETYVWPWSAPESIAWGDQVQDGGAVLGFSYFDLMARLRTLGPDDAARRLREIAAWFDEVEAEGGYRSYYAKPGRGTLQGNNTAGGLGLDAEFFESLLVPQVMLDGFLGFRPTPGGFALAPRLPTDWPSLGVGRVHVQDVVIDLEADARGVTITTRRAPGGGATLAVSVEPGSWSVQATAADGATAAPAAATVAPGGSLPVRLEAGGSVRLERAG